MISSCSALTSARREVLNDEERHPPLVIVATFEARPGYEHELRQALHAVLGPTRLEPGCLRFDMYQGIDPTSSFLLFETFTGQQAVDEHRATDHYREFRAALKSLLARPHEVAQMTSSDVVPIGDSRRDGA
jgi:quinol monooxygenase YgiN